MGARLCDGCGDGDGGTEGLLLGAEMEMEMGEGEGEGGSLEVRRWEEGIVEWVVDRWWMVGLGYGDLVVVVVEVVIVVVVVTLYTQSYQARV